MCPLRMSSPRFRHWGKVEFESEGGPGLASLVCYQLQGSRTLLNNDWDTFNTTSGTANDTMVLPEALWPSGEPYHFFRLMISY